MNLFNCMKNIFKREEKVPPLQVCTLDDLTAGQLSSLDIMFELGYSAQQMKVALMENSYKSVPLRQLEEYINIRKDDDLGYFLLRDSLDGGDD